MLTGLARPFAHRPFAPLFERALAAHGWHRGTDRYGRPRWYHRALDPRVRLRLAEAVLVAVALGGPRR